MLSKADLFARLAEGHAAGVTVVTPNKRLSQALMARIRRFSDRKNLTVWEAPDILPFGAFVERLWEDALYSRPRREAAAPAHPGAGAAPLGADPREERASC